MVRPHRVSSELGLGMPGLGMRTVEIVVDVVWVLNFEHLALEMSQLFSTELRNIQIDVTQKLPKRKPALY